MRERYARRWRSLILLPVALCLAACVSIPESGPVTTRSAEAHPARAQGFIQADAQPARPGMTRTEIAEGFLYAQVSPDLSAARSYLTKDAAQRWKSNARITVFANEGPPTYTNPKPKDCPDTSGIEFSALESGVISQDFDFTATAAGKATFGCLAMSRVDGEWRISQAPNGLYLSPDDVARNFNVYDTYFVEPESGLLVPNPVLVPVAAAQSTRLVQALLSGPSPWLGPAVRTAFPVGSRLAISSAPVRDGVVQVELTQDVTKASPADVRLLGAQLVWTLSQLDGVKAVRVFTPDGAPLNGINGQIDTTSFTTPDPSGPVNDAVGVVKGRVATLGKTVTNLSGAIGARTQLRYPAISAAGDRAAALGKDQTQLVVGDVAPGADLTVRLQASALIAPSFDPDGDVWTAGVGPDGPTIWAVTGAGDAQRVVTPELNGRKVVALRIARDGVRAAVILQDGAKKEALYLGHVVRSDGVITLDGLHRIEAVLGNVSDVAWASADNILVLDESGQLDLVEPFGVVIQTGGPAVNGIQELTAAPQQVILVGTKAGKIYSYDGTNWKLVRKGLDPSYPG